MNKTSLRRCPICQATDCQVLRLQRFILPEGHPLTEGYDVVCCVSCGFVYADTTVTQQDYDEYYTRFSKYEDTKTSTGGGDSAWDAQRLEETASYVAKFSMDHQARILDIGCANGGLLNSFKRLGYANLFGLDPSPICVENIQRLLGIQAFTGSLLSLPNDLGQFDVIILSHVLEHIHDLHRALEGIRRLTMPNGILYIEVPDASRYAEFVIAPFQDFNTEHINHFSLRALSNLFHSAGWVFKAQGSKTILSAPAMPYPAIYAILSRAESKRIEKIEKDDDLCKQVEKYIECSQEIMDSIESKLRRVLESSPTVIVWGTGQLVLKLLAETSLAQAHIAAFVDGNPINQGKLLRGSPILAPHQVRNMNYPIIITSILHNQEIADVIRNQMALPNPLIEL